MTVDHDHIERLAVMAVEDGLDFIQIARLPVGRDVAQIDMRSGLRLHPPVPCLVLFEGEHTARTLCPPKRGLPPAELQDAFAREVTL